MTATARWINFSRTPRIQRSYLHDRSLWFGRFQARYRAKHLSRFARCSWSGGSRTAFPSKRHYTFSHSINDGAAGGGESNAPENVNCRQCDKGPSAFDIRHNFAMNAVYELPFGPGKAYLHEGGVLGKVVGGWELSGIGTWHTGHPLTPSLSYQSNFQLPDGNDQTNQRPDIVPGVPLYLPNGPNGVPQVNPAAFQAPPLSTDPNAQPGAVARFGNAGNGLLRARDIWQVDMALMKETKLTERFGLQFGVQVIQRFQSYPARRLRQSRIYVYAAGCGRDGKSNRPFCVRARVKL